MLCRAKWLWHELHGYDPHRTGWIETSQMERMLADCRKYVSAPDFEILTGQVERVRRIDRFYYYYDFLSKVRPLPRLVCCVLPHEKDPFRLRFQLNGRGLIALSEISHYRDILRYASPEPPETDGSDPGRRTQPGYDMYVEFFREADLDGNGWLDIDELVTVLRRRGFKGSDKEIKVDRLPVGSSSWLTVAALGSSRGRSPKRTSAETT